MVAPKRIKKSVAMRPSFLSAVRRADLRFVCSCVPGHALALAAPDPAGQKRVLENDAQYRPDGLDDRAKLLRVYREANVRRRFPSAMYEAAVEACERTPREEMTCVQEDVASKICVTLLGVDGPVLTLVSLAALSNISAACGEPSRIPLGAFRHLVADLFVRPRVTIKKYKDMQERNKEDIVAVLLARANIDDDFGNLDPGFEACAYLIEKAGIDQIWLALYAYYQTRKGLLKGKRLQRVRSVCPVLCDMLDNKRQLKIDEIFGGDDSRGVSEPPAKKLRKC